MRERGWNQRSAGVRRRSGGSSARWLAPGGRPAGGRAESVRIGGEKGGFPGPSEQLRPRDHAASTRAVPGIGAGPCQKPLRLLTRSAAKGETRRANALRPGCPPPRAGQSPVSGPCRSPPRPPGVSPAPSVSPPSDRPRRRPRSSREGVGVMGVPLSRPLLPSWAFSSATPRPWDFKHIAPLKEPEFGHSNSLSISTLQAAIRILL